MSVHRLLLGGAAVLVASACFDSNEIEAPPGIVASGGSTATPTTTTGTPPMTTTGATPSTTGGPAGMGGTTSGVATGADTSSSTSGAIGTTGMAGTGMGGASADTSTAGFTTGSTDAGGMAAGGSDTGGGDTGTDGNSFGGFGNDDDGGEDTTGTTGGGGQTSTDECRVMLGNVPVCCTPEGENRSNVDEVVELLNNYRISQGRDALAQDPVLEEAMQGHCMHMSQADFFAHESPVSELELPWDRADLCGTNANAENIAWNQQSPSAVMQAWQESSGHNQNMLTNNSTRVGVGEYDLYWGQIFGP